MAATSEFEMRCRLCDTDLGQDWPDLSKLNPLKIKNHPLDAWRGAADWGCPFCNIVISVLDDSWKRYGCHDIFYYKDPEISLDPGWQGFQVLLHPNTKGQYLLALEHIIVSTLVEPPYSYRGTITIYLDGPDTFHLGLEPFVEIPSHSGSPEVLSLARNWLSTCRNSHDSCSAGPNRHENSSKIPNAAIRMIENKSSGPIILQFRLCEVLPAYIALSHCWGSPTTSLKTLSTNIERFQSEIPFESLPTTFKHAMEVAKSLGFDYIWIDSLCIIQDSPLDWEQQSSLMAFVYSKAELVLAASSATSTEDGFLKERKVYRESLLMLDGARDKTRTVRLKYRILHRKDTSPMIDPLDCRAWALQERMLARRYLAFGSHEISWACKASSACECEWWRVATIWRTEIQNIEWTLRRARDNELGDCWRVKVLGDYLNRGLTAQSDNLFAISAIASIFNSRMGSGYLAGLWQADLPVGLLWRNINPESGYIEERATIPSWSWASLPLPGFSFPPRTSRHGKSLVKVLETGTRPSTVNRFGSVSGGFIKVWGELWKTDVHARTLQNAVVRKSLSSSSQQTGSDLDLPFIRLLEQREFLTLDTSLIKARAILPNGEILTSVRRIRLDEIKKRQYVAGFRKNEMVHLFMIPLFRQYHFLYRENVVHGLLLARSLKYSMCFERIGIFFFPETDENQLGSSVDSEAENGGQEIIMI